MRKHGFKSAAIALALSFGAVSSSGLSCLAADTEFKWGFVNAVGKLVISPEYLDAKPFSNGLAAVRVHVRLADDSYDDLWGFIDKTGKLVVAPQFLEAGSFVDGLAPVRLPDSGKLVDSLGSDKSRHWGYIDKSGNFTIAPTFEEADAFSDGLAAVASGGKYGFIDSTGKWSIEPKFDLACRFSDGRAAVMTSLQTGFLSISTRDDMYRADGGVWGYIDKKGEPVIPSTLEACGAFGKGLAPASVGKNQGSIRPDKWGYMDENGKFVIAPKFAEAHTLCEGKAAVKTGTWKNMGKGIRTWVAGKWGYVNSAGKQVIEAKFDGADPFSGGMAAVKIDGKWGYIDTTGKVIIEPQFKGNLQFSEELAPVLTEAVPAETKKPL